MELEKEGIKAEIEDADVVYWKKAFNESQTMIERLKSSLRYETAINEMCNQKLKEAEEKAKSLTGEITLFKNTTSSSVNDNEETAYIG